MEIEPDVVAILAVAAVVTSAVLLVVVVVVSSRLRSLQQAYTVALGDDDADDLVGAIAAQSRRLARVADDVRVVHANTEQLRDVQRGSVSRLGLVRYDAFPDMGGMLSFSAAFLDERGEGLVLTAINGRQEARAYGKPVRDGRSEHSLTDEERAAVRAAMSSGTDVDLPRSVFARGRP